MKKYVISLLLLVSFDIMTTLIGISVGLIELNPLMNKLMNFNYLWIGVKVAISCYCIYYFYKKQAEKALIICNIIMSIIVLSNIFLIILMNIIH